MVILAYLLTLFTNGRTLVARRLEFSSSILEESIVNSKIYRFLPFILIDKGEIMTTRSVYYSSLLLLSLGVLFLGELNNRIVASLF